MKTTVRILSLVLAMLMLVTAFAACGKPPPKTISPNPKSAIRFRKTTAKSRANPKSFTTMRRTRPNTKP